MWNTGKKNSTINFLLITVSTIKVLKFYLLMMLKKEVYEILDYKFVQYH